MVLSTPAPIEVLTPRRGFRRSFVEHPRSIKIAVAWAAIPPAAVASLSLKIPMGFIINQFRQGKTLFLVDASQALPGQACASASLDSGEPEPRFLTGVAAKVERVAADFVVVLGTHRHLERDTGALAH